MIEKVFEGGPAHNSGEIAVGNSILYLDGQDISSKSSKEISQMICGKPGTAIELIIRCDKRQSI